MIFRWIGSRIATGAVGLWSWMSSSSTGTIVKALAVEYAAYSVYNWWVDQNDSLLQSQLVDDALPYLGMMHSRPEMIAKLRPLLNNNLPVTKYMQDKLRLGHIIALYSSSASSSTLGISTIQKDWIDNIVNYMLDDVSTNEEESGMTDDQKSELADRFRMMATRLVRFVGDVYCLEEGDAMLEQLDLSVILTSAIEVCYNSKFYAEWKDGDLGGVSVTVIDSTPLNFFSVIADLYENSSTAMEKDVQYIMNSFNQMFQHTPEARGEDSKLNWKYYMASQCLKAFKQYVMASSQND